MPQPGVFPSRVGALLGAAHHVPNSRIGSAVKSNKPTDLVVIPLGLRPRRDGQAAMAAARHPHRDGRSGVVAIEGRDCSRLGRSGGAGPGKRGRTVKSSGSRKTPPVERGATPGVGHQTTFGGPDTPRNHLTLQCSPHTPDPPPSLDRPPDIRPLIHQTGKRGNAAAVTGRWQTRLPDRCSKARQLRGAAESKPNGLG